MTTPERVRFVFGDTILEGDVVDEAYEARFNQRDRKRLTVDVDGKTYAVLESEAVPA